MSVRKEKTRLEDTFGCDATRYSVLRWFTYARSIMVPAKSLRRHIKGTSTSRLVTTPATRIQHTFYIAEMAQT